MRRRERGSEMKVVNRHVWIVLAFVVGMAAGAPTMNLCFDKCGSYVPALIAVGCIMSAVLVLLQIVITKAHKEQTKIIAEYEAEQLASEVK
jgi:hypothetical protein